MLQCNRMCVVCYCVIGCVLCVTVLLDVCCVLQCNRMCGPGVQTRRVQCASGATQCDQTARPAARLDCNIRPCEGAEWIVSEWQGVSDTALQVAYPDRARALPNYHLRG